MAKRFPANRIRTHLVYTVGELAEVLGCCRQTVIRWIRDHGLAADRSRKPWLIEGQDAKAFLGLRRQKAKHKLALHHCYCLGCKEPREPFGRIADFALQTQETGMLTALCPDCSALMNKVIRRSDLEAIRTRIEVTVQPADPRLVSLDASPLNVTLQREAQAHGKAQQR